MNCKVSIQDVLIGTFVLCLAIPVSAQQQPYPGFWPMGQSLTPKGSDFWDVWTVRSQVRHVPTTVYTLRERWRTLGAWLDKVHRQGMSVPEVRRQYVEIERSVKTGRIKQACRIVDSVFWKLEAAVAEEGLISGRGTIEVEVVDEQQEPVAAAEVVLLGTPLGAITDPQGLCRITDIPVTTPRYTIKVRKAGFLNGYRGGLNAASEAAEPLVVVLRKANPQNQYRNGELAVKVCRLAEVMEIGELPTPLDTGVIDMAMYPKKVLPYLEASVRIDSNHPKVRTLAEQLLESVPRADRLRSTVVAKAVYNWIAQNIEHATLDNYPGDPTCGEWQRRNGAWGIDVGDWAHKASQVIEYRRAVDIEYARLATALLRALHIPARPAYADGTAICQWWMQLPTGNRFWTNMSTAAGREQYKRIQGPIQRLSPVSSERISLHAIDERAPSHMQWDAQSPCFWIEDHGRRAWSPHSKAGREIAQRRMDHFTENGRLPSGIRQDHLLRDPHTRPGYVVSTRGAVIDLASLGDQKTLTFRFPEYVSNNLRDFVETIHWTNHPEWVKTVRTEEEKNELTGSSQRWTVIEFQLGEAVAEAPADEQGTE